MIPIRRFRGDRLFGCGSKRNHIAIFVFCPVILQLAILRFYLRTTGVLQQNGTLLHRAILVGHCEAYCVSICANLELLANSTLRVVRCIRAVKLKLHAISHTLETTPCRVAEQGCDLVVTAEFIKFHYNVFTRIVRPPCDACCLLVAREKIEDQRLQLTVIVTKEVPGICLFKMRRYSQSLRLGVRFAYSQCCRVVALVFGQRVDSDPAAVINHRIAIGIGDRPAIQPVTVLRCGCQRNTCPTGYRLLRACGNCTPCIVAALRLDAYGLHKIRSKGNRRCTNVNS